MEITYQNSPKHQTLIDTVRDWFRDDDENGDTTTIGQQQWSPHASLAYANPERQIPVEVLGDLIQQFPTLKRNRNIVGVSLWSTIGTIDQWKCLDRISFG